MVKIGDLKAGERFLFENHLYIKTDKHVILRSSYPYCVAYYSGKLLPFSNDVQVEKA